MASALGPKDREEFLIRVFFGAGKCDLQRCVDRAYRDFSRTLHGIASKRAIRSEADEAVRGMLATIRGMESATQTRFDMWHRNSCLELVRIYESNNYESFCVGHAQKWLNMTLKYVFVMGETRLMGFGHLYEFCHAPLDSILIKALLPYGFESLGCPWSQLRDYDVYIDRQQWMRERFAQTPLDAEFMLWMRQQPETRA